MSWKNTGWMLAFLTAVSTRLFLKYPEMDIAVSAWFFDPEHGFYLEKNDLFQFIRQLYLKTMYLLVVVVTALLIRSYMIGARRQVPLNVWGFVAASFLVGPILITNTLLKAHWGRARPDDVLEFGGAAMFTPPVLISDQCSANCSFVSGEGSGISAMLIVLAVVLWPNLKGWWRALALATVPLSLFAIALRVVTGRHFLSDTIFAILVSAIVAWGFYAIFNMKAHRHALTRDAFVKDLKRG